MTSHFRTFECIHSTIPGVFGAIDLLHASGAKEATPIGTRGSQVSQNNFFEKLACLPATKSGQQPHGVSTQSTASSPQKHHRRTLLSLKPPIIKPAKPAVFRLGA